MPNDPRVKFHKGGKVCKKDIEYLRKHPECRLGHRHLPGGEGSSGRGLRSIYEDEEPPPDTGGGGTPGGGGTGGGTGGNTSRATEIPQAVKPSLNAGEITGATIGSIAAAAAAIELTRRALEERERRRGMRPITQPDQIRNRQSGVGGRQRSVGISRGLGNVASQAIEMITPTRAEESARLIQAEFAPESIVSSPSNSGTVTPDLQSARSRSNSGASTPDFQSARSGASTPSSGELSSIRPGARGFQQQPSALAAIAATPAPARPNVPLNLIQEIEARQLEIRMPTTSGGRIKTLQNEIRILEEQIRASGTIYTPLEERINLAMNTPLPKPVPAPAPAPKPVTAPAPAPAPATESSRPAPSTATEIEMSARPGFGTARIPPAPPDTRLEGIRAGIINEISNLETRMSLDTGLSIGDTIKIQEQIDNLTTNLELSNIKSLNDQLQRAVELSNVPGGSNEPREIQLEKGRLSLIDQRLKKPMSAQVRKSIAAVRERINTRLTALKAQQGNIETGIEMNRAGSRASLQPTTAIERARAANAVPREAASTSTSTAIPREAAATDITRPTVAAIIETERAIVGQTEPLKFTSTMTPKKYSEFRNQAELTAGKAALERSKARLSGLERPPPAERPAPERPPVDERPSPRQPSQTAPIEAEPEPPPRSAPVERPPVAEVQKMPPPPPATVRPVATETAVDRFNKIFDRMVEGHITAGYEIPEAPPGLQGIEKQKYIMDEIIRETVAADELITREVKGEQVTVSPEEAFAAVEKVYDRALNDPTTRRPVEAIAPEEHIGTAVPKGKKGRLIKGKGLLATNEQRPMQTALTGEASRARLRPTEARAAPAEMRAAPAPEVAARSAPAPAPEIAARRRLSAAPELPAPTAAPPEERASFAERRAFFEETSRVAPPIEPRGAPGASPPPSAPGSGTATPQEGATVERTPTEQMSFAEELSTGLKGKKVPGRQKVKINSGIANKTSLNPLERFVAPQFRNAPNVEIHPSAKNLRGALTQLSSRVPTLVPSRKVLISAGINVTAEGGGAVTGFFAGSEAGKAMSNYFATHPPTNRTDEYGQALATSMVALGVGNVVSKAVTYAIRQGARVAMGAQISGSISSAGAAGATAIAEAALFATVATTTQFYVTKALEDSGNSHAYSRTLGSIAATESLMYLEVAMWAAKGGIFNPAADLALIASEVFIIGFGIWSAFEEFAEGKRQDENEAQLREEERLERIRAEQERRDTVATINRTNAAKAAFLQKLPLHDYDFDELYARLSDKEKQDLGITSPETKLSFQRDIERAFDPFGAFQSPGDGGLIADPPIPTQAEKDRGEVMNSYINWYIEELRGVRHPPFNFNDPKVRELNEYSGGTWKSAAEVSASTNHLQSERVHPLIEKAQNEIIDAFHKERKPIEEMDPLTIRYATLDPTFRANYEAYIITDAAAQILVEFNNTQSTYNQVDPALLAIADRDPSFRAAADQYYQVLANQARDYQLTISQVAHLNSLMETDQAIELGKLNEARNKIIEKNQAENQAQVDAYNANILREINIYGDNFEAIIRNINEQSLLSGHTFLYASNRADLYRQLHLEVPAIEFVDPVDEVDGERPDATWHQGKGRKAGDTAIYGYRYNLTDEQNQEIEDMIANNQISRFDAEKQAIIIYNRDRARFVQTDEEKAADLGLSLDAYYKKFGITDPTVISSEPTYKDLQTLYPAQYRDLQRKYAGDPDADSKIEATLSRAHKRRMEESGGIYTPLEQAPDLPVETLQQMYPDYYESMAKNLRKRDGTLSPESTKFLEISLRMHHDDAVKAGTAPPVPAETREPTYEELQVMYPDQFQIYDDANITTGQEDKTEGMLRRLHARRTEAGTAPPLPVQDIVIDPNLKNGIVNMPDGSTRTYRNGLVVNVMYGEGVEKMKLTDIKNSQEINAAEGVQNSSYTPTQPAPTTLKQGFVRMPDGSKRFYVDGKVVSVDYPEGVTGKTIHEINDSEGVKTEPVKPPNTDGPVERPAGWGESDNPDAVAERLANVELQRQRIAAGGAADEFDRIVPGSLQGYGEGGDVQRPGTNQNGETIRQENDPNGP